jgi:hypothetical protein
MIAAVVGATSAVVFLQVLQKFAKCLITCALYGSLVVQGVLTAIFFVVAPILGVIFLIFFLLQAFYVWWVRDRIPFASAILKAASAAIDSNKSVACFAVGMVGVQLLWSLVWCLASLGVSSLVAGPSSSSSSNTNSVQMTNSVQLGNGLLMANSTSVVPTSNSSQTGQLAVLFVSTVSFVWGAQLLTYIVQFVIAATVAAWWFETETSNAVKNGINRAFTSSFGSLSLAALIVAIIEASKRVSKAVTEAAKKDNAHAGIVLAAAICTCIIGCIQEIIEYFQSWAICVMAITGDTFYNSGKEVIRIFKERGWTAIVNDNLIGPALTIACFAPAIISALVGALLTGLFAVNDPNAGIYAIIGGVLSFFIGLFMASLMTEILNSSCKTVFVCFALNPAALYTTHPQSFQEIVSAWQQFHPEIYATSGYGQMVQAVQAGTYFPGGSKGTVVVMNPSQSKY